MFWDIIIEDLKVERVESLHEILIVDTEIIVVFRKVR